MVQMAQHVGAQRFGQAHVVGACVRIGRSSVGHGVRLARAPNADNSGRRPAGYRYQAACIR